MWSACDHHALEYSYVVEIMLQYCLYAESMEPSAIKIEKKSQEDSDLSRSRQLEYTYRRTDPFRFWQPVHVARGLDPQLPPGELNASGAQPIFDACPDESSITPASTACVHHLQPSMDALTGCDFPWAPRFVPGCFVSYRVLSKRVGENSMSALSDSPYGSNVM